MLKLILILLMTRLKFLVWSIRLHLALQDITAYQSTTNPNIQWILITLEKCNKYKPNQARPVVGLPHATEFNQCVGMDLKQWSYGEKIWLLHLVDHLTRYSASCVIRSKRKEVIVEGIFKTWISVFGNA